MAYGFSTRLGGRLAGAAVTIAALHEATHYFGDGRWGTISAAIAWVGIFVALAYPGITTYTMREVGAARPDGRAVLGVGLRAVSLTSLCCVAAALLAGLGAYWGRPHTLLLVVLVVWWVPFMAWFQFGGSMLAALGRSDVRGLLDVVSSALLLGGTLVVVHEGLSDGVYVLAFAGSMAVSGLVALALALRRVGPRGASSSLRVPTLVKAAIPFGQVDIFAAVYNRADALMLYFVRGESAIAVYAVAYQVAAFVMVAPAFLTGALLKDFMAADRAERRRLARRTLEVACAIALAVPLLFSVFARPFVLWLAGPGFSGAIPVLVVLSVAAAIAFVDGVLYQLAVFAGARRRLWRVVGIVTAVNLGCNAVAVPLFGPMGAACVMVLSELVALVFYWQMFMRVVGGGVGLYAPVAAAVAAALVGAGCVLCHAVAGVGAGSGLAMAPRALLLAVAYAGLLGLALAGRHRLLGRLAAPCSSRGRR